MSRDGFAIEEYYHCYNRGTDKRDIFLDDEDFHYFLDALTYFNQSDSLGSMRAYRYEIHKQKVEKNEINKLVDIVAYCLNRNHYHLLLRECTDSGISKFIQKVGTGYTKYFNEKYNRNGVLFQGKFKYVHISNDIQLQHVGIYVNLNNLIHGVFVKKNYRSSFDNYDQNTKQPRCLHNILTDRYENIAQYKKSSLDKLPSIKQRKDQCEEIAKSEFIAD